MIFFLDFWILRSSDLQTTAGIGRLEGRKKLEAQSSKEERYKLGMELWKIGMEEY